MLRASARRISTGSSMSNCGACGPTISTITSCITLPRPPSGNVWWHWALRTGSRSQKAAGRIRQIGFSYHGSAVDFLTMLDAYDWDFCQIQYNYAGERYQAGTAGLMAAAERGLAVFVMEPLLGGRLAGKLPPRARAVLDSARDPHLRTPAAWGLSWVWNHPQVTMLLSGMTDIAQVDENSSLADLALPNSMTANQLDTIARVLMEFEKSNRVPCTGCGYCMPCPKGINIPWLLCRLQRELCAQLVYGAVAILYGECGAHERAQAREQLRQVRQMRAPLPTAHRYSRASRRCAPTFPAWSRDGGA